MYIRLFCRFHLMYNYGRIINQKITKVYHASLFQRENIYAAAIFNLNTLIKPLNNSTPWWEWLKKLQLLDKKTSPVKNPSIILEDRSVMWSITLCQTFGWQQQGCPGDSTFCWVHPFGLGCVEGWRWPFFLLKCILTLCSEEIGLQETKTNQHE